MPTGVSFRLLAGWIFKSGMKALGFALSAACFGSLTFYYVCRAVVGGAVSALTHIGYKMYVTHSSWHWSTAVAYFVWGQSRASPDLER